MKGVVSLLLSLSTTPPARFRQTAIFAAMTLCTTYESNANLLSNFEPVKL